MTDYATDYMNLEKQIKSSIMDAIDEVADDNDFREHFSFLQRNQMGLVHLILHEGIMSGEIPHKLGMKLQSGLENGLPLKYGGKTNECHIKTWTHYLWLTADESCYLINVLGQTDSDPSEEDSVRHDLKHFIIKAEHRRIDTEVKAKAMKDKDGLKIRRSDGNKTEFLIRVTIKREWEAE